MTFRPATSEDVERLAALVNSAYRGDSSRRGWTTEADLLGGQRTDEDALREMIASPDTRILLRFEAGELIGCVQLRRRPDAAYLGMLTVQPDRQAGGLGRALLAEAEAFVLREWGLRRIEMTVIQHRHELIAWYERRGYHLTGRREAFPHGDPRFGLPKLEDLEFVVLEKQLPG